MDNPYSPVMRRKSGSSPPPPKNRFQQELDAKLKERRSRGLSAPSPTSDLDEDDDELNSGDELLSQFNLTSKKSNRHDRPGSAKGSRSSPGPGLQTQRFPSPSLNKSPSLESTPRLSVSTPRSGRSPLDDMFSKKSPRQSEENIDMMATMRPGLKGTWQPPAYSLKKSDMDARERESANLLSPKSRTADAAMMGGRGGPWTPPSMKKAETSSGAKESDPKSGGRKTPLLESISESSPRFPKPVPRRKSLQSDTDESPRSTGEKPKPIPRGRFSSKKEDTDRKSEERPKSRGSSTDLFGKGRKSPADDLFGKGRKTPDKERETSPSRTSPLNYKKGKESPKFDRKASLKNDEKEASEKRRKSVLDFMEPENDQRKGNKYLSKADSRDSIGEEIGKDRKSPPIGSKGRKSPLAMDGKGRKSPFAMDDKDIKSSLADRMKKNQSSKGPYSDAITQRRSSQKKAPVSSDEDSDEEYEHKSMKRLSRSKTLPEQQAEVAERARIQKMERSKSLQAGYETSSVCEDVEEDPTMIPPEAKEHKELKKKTPTVQTREKQILDSVIDSIADAQDKNRTMQYIEPDKEKKDDEKSTETKAKLPKHRPKPRYVTPAVSEAPPTPTFNSSSDIRQAVYEEWKKERQQQAKKDLLEKKKKEKETAEKLKQEKDEKVIEAKASYNAWMEQKKEQQKEKSKGKRKEEEKKRKKFEEEQEKKKDAEHSFKSWKENKDVYIKEKEREKKREQEKKEKEEEDLKKLKKKDAETSFSGWKLKKDKTILQKVHEEKNEKRKLEKEEEKKQKEREEEAMKSYLEWEQRKAVQMVKERSLRKTRTMVEYEAENRPAWSPASRTVPFGR